MIASFRTISVYIYVLMYNLNNSAITGELGNDTSEEMRVTPHFQLAFSVMFHFELA